MTDPITAPCHLCRCEEIAEAEVRAAVADGARTVNDVKRRTRAGMGLCQGVYCVPAIAAILHQQRGEALGQIAPMTARPPVRSLPLSELTAFASDDRDP